METQNALTLW